jgi:glycosyltransferase involved in cell wall biosynthesis
MKKVLVITYYWPPSGGAGVQRWLKFTKYLRNYGWEPIIYTPENPEAPVIDLSLEKDIPDGLQVIKTRIWEPYSAYKRFVGRKKEDSIKGGFLSENKRPSLTEKISVWIRGNFFIPDARKFWIKPSVKFLVDYLKKNPVDAMVSTGPPHSLHRIALGIKKKLNIPWLADFRDPWTKIDFYDDLMLTSFAHRKHRRLEREVLNAADKVVTVSWDWAKDFENLCSRQVDVVTNGYDPEDFRNLPQKSANEKFLLCHIGSLNKDRNPKLLWKCLAQLVENDSGFGRDLRIRFIGQVDYKVFDDLIRFNLMNRTEKIEYLPHDETLRKAAESSVLLLLLNNTPNVNGIIPGKVFEYLALQRPILCIGPEGGDSARIIRDCKAGLIVGFEDVEGIKSSINNLYREFITGDAWKVSQQENFDHYSRKKLAGDIADLLYKIVGN